MTTKVFLLSAEVFPSSVKSTLRGSADIEICETPVGVELILIYAEQWNRKALVKIQPILLEHRARAIVISDRPEEPFTRDSVLRGQISGVLSSNATAEQLASAARAAAAGLRVLQPPVEIQQQPEPALTPRELEILRLIADGEGNKSIAGILEISEHTVKFHISSIFEKLQAFSRTEAVRAGIIRGLVSI